MKRVVFRMLLAILAGVLPISAARAAEVCEAPPTSDPLMIREVPNQFGLCTELASDQHQWGAYTLNLPGAWARVTGHANLGVVDLGLDVEHPDLQDLPPGFGPSDTPGNFRLHLSHDFRLGDSCPDELQTTNPSTGCPGDLTGAQGPSNTPNAGHGTHVSGIAAANTDNAEGVAGTCQRCSLLMSRSRVTNSSPDLVVPPIYWAVDRGAQVINGSFGYEPRAVGAVQCHPGDPETPATPLSFTHACFALALADQRDVVIVASAGNDREAVDFPASDPRSIAVGGVEVDGSLWRRDDDPGEVCPLTGTVECGSNSGPELDLVAPAESILSTAYRGRVWISDPAQFCGERAGTPGYGPCTGTSMAAPFVTGIAGLVRSANPLLRKGDVYSILIADARREGCADDPSALWDPECGYGVPDAEAAARRALGPAGGQTLVNRLTPLFSLYSSIAEDHLYTTVPQVASSAYHGQLYENCTALLRENCTATVPYVPFGPAVPWYTGFPGASCTVSPCFEPPAGASVYIFTTDAPPFPGAVLVPLYRLSYRGPNAAGDNPSNRDTAYTTESAGIIAFRNATFPGSSEGYELDAIEGWIFKKCTPEPGCIPPGAVRLYRRYNEARDDFAIFPEAELTAMAAQGYTSDGGTGTDVLGYVYPNVSNLYPNADADGDRLIEGFERLAGTDPAKADSDCDGTSDGTEVLLYPYGDPRGSACVDSPPVPSFTVSCSGLTCTFDGRGSTDDRGIATWSWNFGDATSGTGSVVTHPYPIRGTYPVVLTVTDTGNQSVSSQPPRAVYVDALPVPRFTFTCTGRTCTFDGRTSTDDVGINLYQWNFGDGFTGTGSTIVHTFPGSGPYPVTLRVTDTHNQSVTSSPQEFREDLPPVPCFTHACTGLSCTFDARCSTDDRGIVSWSWSFGDGTGGTGQIVTHLYPRKDLFTATLTVTDTGSQTRSTSKTLDLRNDPPDARDDGWSTYRNVATNVPYWNLLRNDFDPNGDVLTVTSVNTAGLTGTLNCTVSSSYCLYTPPSWFIGTTSFTYTASDGRGGTDTATVRIKVGVTNNLPVPGVDLLTTRRGTALPFTQATLLANDTDADGDVLFVESVTPRYGVGFGTVSCTTPVYNCTYTPPAGFIGVDNVDYRVMDGISQTLGRVAFTVEPPTPAVLDAREDQIFTTTTTTYISYTLLLSNDYDPEAGPLTVVSVDTAGLLGTLDCTTYPTGCEYRRGTSDPTRFRYTVRDNQGNLDTATVTLKPGNWAFNKVPQTAPDQLMTARNTPVGFSIFHLLRNDYDPDNDQLNIFVNWSSPSGRVTCTTPQYFCTYTPNVGFTGVDTVGYTVNDGTNSATGTLTVTVSP